MGGWVREGVGDGVVEGKVGGREGRGRTIAGWRAFV